MSPGRVLLGVLALRATPFKKFWGEGEKKGMFLILFELLYHIAFYVGNFIYGL